MRQFGKKLEHLIRSNMALSVFLAVLCGAVLMVYASRHEWPALICGIPSVYWAPGGTTVALPNGSRMEYLTRRESRDAYAPTSNPAVDYVVPEDQLDLTYHNDFWLDIQESVPSLFRVEILGGRDFSFVPIKEDRQFDMPSQRSIVYARIKEVVYDESPTPQKAGNVISIAWCGYHENGGCSNTRYLALYRGEEYYLSLWNSREGSWVFAHYSEAAQQDERTWIANHAQNVFWDYMPNTHGCWPISEDSVYALRNTVRNVPYEESRQWGYPIGIYPKEEFAASLRAFFDEVREKRGQAEMGS